MEIKSHFFQKCPDPYVHIICEPTGWQACGYSLPINLLTCINCYSVSPFPYSLKNRLFLITCLNAITGCRNIILGPA
jgi:hypothetical protein